MADIDVQRKGPGIWPWIIGLIVLALLIWLLAEMFDNDEADVAIEEPVATEPAVAPQPVDPGAATAGGPTISDVLANPSNYYGQSFSTGAVTAGEVIGDRSFWIQGEGGERLLVVKNESPEEGVADVEGPPDMRPARNVNAGERLQLNGTLMDATNLDAVQPPLDAATRQALQGQQIFLQANVSDIQHM